MSHHASGPNFGFPRGDARLDMTDFYVFTKPSDPAKSIIILNVHPSFALNPPGPTTNEPFAPGALYEVKVDTDGDAVADLAYSVQFSSLEDGKQTATLRRIQGVRAAGVGEEGEVIVQEAPVSVGREALVTQAGDFRFFSGWRSDPFFFDANGNFNKMQFTGDDFFTDKNVCSIVLELPNSALATNEMGLWARTVDKTAKGWIQADRGGRPLQAVFLPGEERDAYLSGEPADDDRFVGVFAHQLEHTGGYAPDDAKSVARKLLPDILSYDPRRPVSFPHNGRTLSDDVVDVFFSMLTNGKVTGDKVGPHCDLLDEFPYLGPPHKAQQNVQLAQKFYTDFKRADVTGVLSTLTDDVDWFIPGPKDPISFAGQRQGREQVAQLLVRLAQLQDAEEFEVREFIAQADKVIAIGHYQWRVKSSGRSYASDWVHAFTVRDNKVSSFREYLDTYAWATAYRAAQSAAGG